VINERREGQHVVGPRLAREEKVHVARRVAPAAVGPGFIRNES
jgi:hypothetical protein